MPLGKRESKVKVCFTVVFTSLALYYCFYIFFNQDGTFPTSVGFVGFAATGVAVWQSIQLFSQRPVREFLQEIFLYFIPAYAVPIVGALHVEFPFSGLMALIWPVGLAICFVYNNSYLSWASQQCLLQADYPRAVGELPHAYHAQ